MTSQQSNGAKVCTRLLRALGWAIMAYGALDLLWLIIYLKPWNVSHLEFSKLAYTQPSDPILLTFIRGLGSCICGFLTIRSPAFVTPALGLVVLLTALKTPFDLKRVSQYIPETTRLIAVAFDSLIDTLVALAIVSYWLCRRIHAEQHGTFCSTCRYDLRGATGLLCPECGRGFAPLEYYGLFDRSLLLLVKSFGVGMLALGIGNLAARCDLILYLFRLILGVLSPSVSLLSPYDVRPSLFAGTSQAVAGAIELHCGVAIIKSPRLVVRASCIALVVAVLHSCIEHHAFLMELGRSYKDLVRRMSWFLDSFHAELLGLIVLIAMYSVRDKLGSLERQCPVCRDCGALIVHPQDLCCVQCGRRYSPMEFAQLESGRPHST